MTRDATARLLLIAVLCAALAGCGPDPPPDPGASDLSAARKDATARAEDELDDACYAGQNNWKVHDGYDHRCTIRRVAAVTFAGDFRKRIARLDRRLFASGWGCTPTPCHDTNAGLLEESWSSRAAHYGTQDFPISSLPTATGYEKDRLYFDLRYAGAEPVDRGVIEDWHRRRRGGLFESFRVPRPLDVDAVVRNGRDSRYLVLLAVDADYFDK